MGIFRKLSSIIKGKKEKMTILVIGLNNSGKSTLINSFRSAGVQQTKTKKETTTTTTTATIGPTVGFNVERFRCHGVSFTWIDTSGARRYRGLWEHHLASCQGIVYVIDASDQMRLVVVRDELEALMRLEAGSRVPILFYGNKSDSEDGLSSAKIASAIGLEKICQQPWQIVFSNALSGEGLEEGVQWLVEQIRGRR